MSFDYTAYIFPSEMIESLQKNTESFLSVFYESNYAEEFDEVKEELGDEIDKLGVNAAKNLYDYVQVLLEDEEKTLDIDGEYWASPLHFFLTEEFDENEEEVLPQPKFSVKTAAGRILINALAGTDSAETETDVVLITPADKVKEIAAALPEILKEDFRSRWDAICESTGQYGDVFEEKQDLEDFINDLREFIDEILIPFYQDAAKTNSGIVVMFD
jgi:Domain of unknown function (DUF1877)